MDWAPDATPKASATFAASSDPTREAPTGGERQEPHDRPPQDDPAILASQDWKKKDPDSVLILLFSKASRGG